MSKSTKTGITVIVIIIIAIIVWIWYNNSSSSPSSTSVNTETPVTQTPPVTQVSFEDSNGLSVASDNSNAALDQNIAVIDAQLSGLGNDTAAVDDALNAK